MVDGAFTDKDGLVTDSFLEYISRGQISEESKAKLEQLKDFAKREPAIVKLIDRIFKIGYGACVWDHKIGLDEKDDDNAK